MAISRGTVRHKLFENILDLCNSFLETHLLRSPSQADEKELKTGILKLFPNTKVSLFPFARTCLYATLRSLQLPERSKILMTPITIGPMVEVIESLGYEVIFVDIETVSFGPSIDDLKIKLQADAACLLLTHLFGYVSAVDQIVAMCHSAGVIVIEDISHNIGSKLGHKPLGLWGDVGLYSASLLKYVDGYNGAFTLTRNSEIAAAIERESRLLTEPAPFRVRAAVLKALIWNLALNRTFFSLFTWPALRILKVINRKLFERLLGPGIPFNRSKDLPSFYFEKITKLQCIAITRNLDKLSSRLSLRKKSASYALKALESFGSCSLSQVRQESELVPDNTYWQFIVPVKNTEVARLVLFDAGVETNTTNLRDLSYEYGIELPNARKLKNNYIFIPLHDYLDEHDYIRILNVLNRAGQLNS